MADTTTTPNMGLPVPVPSTAPGPDWAQNIVADMYAIDGHNHTSGQGVPITPAAMSINADLTFGNNNATALRSVNFTSQDAPIALPTDLGCVYVSGDDLYYNDEQGNQIRITQGGSVAGSTGTITGLPSGTASAAYSTGTFTFESATSTPATMAVGPVIIGRQASGTKTVTLTPDAAQAANYALTFPAALPAAANIVTLDNTGAIAFNSSGVTGTGAVVQATSPTITTPTLASPTFSGTASGIITSATYTPTVTNVQGTTATTPSFSYIRVNTRVHATGRLTATTNASGQLRYTITLPVAPTNNFTQTYQIQGGPFVEAATSLVEFEAFATTGAKTATVQITLSAASAETVYHSLYLSYDCA